MRKMIFGFVVISLFSFSNAGKSGIHRPEKPEVFVLDALALAANKKKLKSNDPIMMASYKLLIKDADEAMEFGPVSVMEKKNIPPSGDKHDYMSLAPYYWPDPAKPDGLPYIRKDGQTNPEVKDYKDKEYQPALCSNVYTLALAYYFSDEKEYAQQAARLIRVWFLNKETAMNPNLNFAQAMKGQNTGRGAGLIDTRHYVNLIDAISLISHSLYWTDDDQHGMKKWFADFLNWMQTSPNGVDEMDAPNNHGAWYDAQRLSMALYIGDKDLAKKIVINAQDRLDKQIDANGSFPKEMERTISLHYTTFVMEAFFNIALMADDAGIDLWHYTSPSGKSLEKAFTVLRPYLVKEKEWQGQQINEFDYEEGYFLLKEANLHFNCGNCEANIKSLAGDKYFRLRMNLLY